MQNPRKVEYVGVGCIACMNPLPLLLLRHRVLGLDALAATTRSVIVFYVAEALGVKLAN